MDQLWSITFLGKSKMAEQKMFKKWLMISDWLILQMENTDHITVFIQFHLLLCVIKFIFYAYNVTMLKHQIKKMWGVKLELKLVLLKSCKTTVVSLWL